MTEKKYIKLEICLKAKLTLWIFLFNVMFIIPTSCEAFICNPEFTYVANRGIVAFFNNSDSADNWFWDFGDGSTDTLQNPIHEYDTLGKYTVFLKVTGLCGIDSIYKDIEVLDAFCSTCISLGNELVTNGDFEGGNTGFYPGMSFNVSPPLLEGQYTIDKNAFLYNGSWLGKDHTSGKGNFMICNGKQFVASTIWYDSIPVDTNKKYRFGVWVNNIISPSAGSSLEPLLVLSINAQAVSKPIRIPKTPDKWLFICGEWNADTSSIAAISVNALSKGLAGNDFGIDDVTFRKITDTVAVEVELRKDTTICIGDVITLSVDGPFPEYHYLWSTQDTTVSIEVEGGGEYSIVVTSDTCVVKDTVVVSLVPEINAYQDTTICLGDSVDLASDTAYSYLWSPGLLLNDSTAQNTVANPKTSTIFRLIATNQCGADTAYVNVDIFPLTVSVVSDNTTIIEGDSIQLEVLNAINSLWYGADNISCDSCHEISLYPNSSTTIYVSGIDSMGCAYYDSIGIEVLPKNATLFLPQAFTPNFDGNNDQYIVLNPKEIKEINYLKVYNRWGELIFQTDDKNKGWDGIYQGDIQENGMYTYHVEYTGYDLITKFKQGFLMLLK